MATKIYQVDAFTGRRFHGNPAAVVALEGEWPEDDLLQAVAGENNLSETAYLRPSSNAHSDYDLRWFTPMHEAKLCGHATLGSAHVLRHHLGDSKDEISFSTLSGVLKARFESDLIAIDMPARNREPREITPELVEALRDRPDELYLTGEDLLCVFDNKRRVHELRPDFGRLADYDARAVIITAPGGGHDFVSRFFAPRCGVLEDPVTGSAHCALVPFWAERLSKPTLTAHQVSKRSGELFCKHLGDRVEIAGRCVTYLEGAIWLDR